MTLFYLKSESPITLEITCSAGHSYEHEYDAEERIALGADGEADDLSSFEDSGIECHCGSKGVQTVKVKDQ